MPQRVYTLKEEIGNTTTHVIGALICAFLFGMLFNLSCKDLSFTHLISCCIFGLTSSFVFIASSLYHAISNIGIKNKLKKYDHIAIYFLIAGTYIPIALASVVPYHPIVGYLFIVLQALSVLCGVLYKTLAQNRYGLLSVAIYCGLGWTIIPLLPFILQNINVNAMHWFLAGGMMYMLGVPFYILKQYMWTHTIWHVLVVFGIICHYTMMFKLF